MVNSTDNADQNEFDSDQQHLASVYAKSIIDAAENAGKTESILEGLDSFVTDVLGKIPKLAMAFDSPRVSTQERAHLIEKSLAGRADQMLINFLKVVNEHGRLNCLGAINQKAKSLLNELRGRVEVSVTVAESLSSDLEGSVKDKLEAMLGKEVILNVQTDSEIIGGMIVKVGDTVYDSSVANQLEQLRRHAFEGTMTEVRGSVDRFAVEAESNS